MAVKKILIAQDQPKVMTQYEALSAKYGVSFDFIPFFDIKPVTSLEMRAQHCNPLEYGAIVLSSRRTIDALFSLCEELRVKIPETMKYFCTNEKVAMYLQKHIIYRKRKIFFGDGTTASVLNLIGTKHKGEKFMVVTADSPESSLTKALTAAGYDNKGVMFAKSVPCDLKERLKIDNYDMLVFYNKHDVKSLLENFPDYKQGNKALVAYGSESLKSAATEAGLNISICAPTPEYPSVAAAIEAYLKTKS